MNFHFCTITTKSHLFKCFALADSIAAFNGILNVLLIDDNKVNEKSVPHNIQFNYLNDLNTNLAEQIKSKYSQKADKLRWSLKPIYLTYLLKENHKIIYVDNDIFFYNNFSFLFDELDKNAILLTPHHYNRDPKNNQNWLEANFRVGLYNAGFVAVNQNALPTMDWWANACLYRCEKNYWRGLYDDQKYLDLFPIIEARTKIIRHNGCNVAAWNDELCPRNEVGGKILINNKYMLIFYHFNEYSIRELKENDPVLNQYLGALKAYKENASELFKKEGLSLIHKIKLSLWNILNKMNK